MPALTFKQLERRTKHELISDEEACVYDRFLGPMTVRKAERSKEARYPLHKRLRQAANAYFHTKRWDVVPHGVGVWGANKAMADLAIAKERRIILVECLTPWCVYQSTVVRKKRLEKFFPLWFVIEDPAKNGDVLYKKRAERLARANRVFIWSKGKILKLYSTGLRKTARRGKVES